ncbi:SOS response-associated peptidase [Aeromicrobium phragmitis]|uniref:Abasic site processing protein n=1 Tax=Aeromicrobium phragmitis TaxID=2478914 RepID=A0A3L8PQQ3_9ACTN|nr:SOS response-associated peptidase [Aeromicrobium phragmitis]RLV56788.1 SOS response-associated peptidase [Aeromicrobium phragmitis]
MCGRYATSRTSSDLERDFEANLGDLYADTGEDYNAAPTKPEPLVLARRDEDAAATRREVVTARWGLIPSWAKDPSIGNKLINARSETVAEKPSFRKAFARRRALVPADGFYEWYQPQPREGEAKPRKQPFYLTGKDGQGLALAGLYEFWKDPEGQWVLSYTILTTSAEGDDGRIHDRAPLLVPADLHEAWLDPGQEGGEVLGELAPATPGALELWPVSTAVNNVRNNGPELIQPLRAE